MLKPFEWKDKPALIEHLFPVQKISAESYKEQMAGSGKTLTALGSYWKGRKPLILNKACILGSLLPITENLLKDLEVFELLMAMDSESLQKRIEATLPASKKENIAEYLKLSYNEQVRTGKRPEELDDSLFSHIWEKVNSHLGTHAFSFSELIEQMGMARFGHRPKVADVFCGSGQIPFEAARLGCDVYASDLNPIACMLTWGAFNIVGASEEKRKEIENEQKKLADSVQQEIDKLGVETDGNGWRAKVYLYCVEVKCPETGWMVPLIPSCIVSKDKGVIIEIIPIPKEKRYAIEIKYVNSEELLNEAQLGTIQGGDVIHSPDGVAVHRISIKTIRGDYKEGKENKNGLRMWEKFDFIPREDDVFQERLYCVQWMKKKAKGSQYDYEFRSVTEEDLMREQKVIDYVKEHLEEWQEKGHVPDMMIEKGDETERLYRERGWTYWHHLFNARQLLVGALVKMNITMILCHISSKIFNFNSRLSRWDSSKSGTIQATFDNQALNTLYNNGTRTIEGIKKLIFEDYKVNDYVKYKNIINSHPAQELDVENDIYITDPPYGDAVKYEEITEFFIAWLRKNPPQEFAHWTWDSRRSLAIKGEDESFRQGMIAAYRKMAQKMPDNGIQVLMFTHQSVSIWADMANIIWASGLKVTAAWYVVTETNSALRRGANVKGTVILVLRKSHTEKESFRDDLGWEIEEAVKEQVESLGLDKKVRSQNQEGLYTGADLQMAGYAAALKVLTSYSKIDGKDMVVESESPRQVGKKTFVEDLIEFAVQTAVQFLVPVGFEKGD